MLSIDLNCDLGEGYGNDAEIMPWISSANISCGYHAGDEQGIEQTILLALRNNVAVGAHPSFFDKRDFGRKEHLLSQKQYYDLVTDQLNFFQKIAAKCGSVIHHVKPHGALYNMSARSELIARTIAKAVHDFDNKLILYGLSGSYSVSEGENQKIRTISEVFADRSYRSDGSLVPRGEPNAVIQSPEMVKNQLLSMILEHAVRSADNTIVHIKAETICLHGDGERAVEFVLEINRVLQEHQIAVQAPLQIL